MSRRFIYSPRFVRSAKRLVKKMPGAEHSLEQVLRKLADDPFDASLKTHKLKGELTNCWSCSAGYDLRIIFSFVEREGREAILLQRIGAHDEVY